MIRVIKIACEVADDSVIFDKYLKIFMRFNSAIQILDPISFFMWVVFLRNQY